MKKTIASITNLVRLAAIGTAATSLSLCPAPALAHDVRYDGPYWCGIGGLQSCGYGKVRDNHKIVEACDTRRDGMGFLVRYELASGEQGIVNDGNGSAKGCGTRTVGSFRNPIIRFTVCANSNLDICSLWKPVS